MRWLRILFTKRSAPEPEPYVWWVKRDLETAVDRAVWREQMAKGNAAIRAAPLAQNAPPPTRADLHRLREQSAPLVVKGPIVWDGAAWRSISLSIVGVGRCASVSTHGAEWCVLPAGHPYSHAFVRRW